MSKISNSTWRRGYNNLSLRRKIAVKNGAPLLIEMCKTMGHHIGKHRHVPKEKLLQYNVQPFHPFISFDDLPKFDASDIDRLW